MARGKKVTRFSDIHDTSLRLLVERSFDVFMLPAGHFNAAAHGSLVGA